MQKPQYSYKGSDIVLSPPAPPYPGSPQRYIQQQQSYGYPVQPSPNIPVQSTQPGTGPVMDMRNVRGLPRDGKGERGWSNGCADFTDDCGTCCFGSICPCILYSQIESRYLHLESNGQAHPEGGNGCTYDCFAHGLLTACCGVGWILQIGQRSAIRSRYGVSGNGCSDCLMAYFCTPCELTQASRELELEEEALRSTAIVAPGFRSTQMVATDSRPNA